MTTDTSSTGTNASAAITTVDIVRVAVHITYTLQVNVQFSRKKRVICSMLVRASSHVGAHLVIARDAAQ
jgi:hypothetical protein